MRNIEFADRYFRIPWRGSMPHQSVELHRHQKALLNNLEENPKTIVDFPRQSGVSTCLAIHIANSMVGDMYEKVGKGKITCVISHSQQSASYLIDKIRALLEEYRNTQTDFTPELFYKSNSKQKIIIFNNNEVRVVSNSHFLGKDDAERVEKVIFDNSAHIKNLDYVEQGFKLNTAVKQIIIATTSDGSRSWNMARKAIKPPIGLIPKEIWVTETFDKRFEDVKAAIKRYFDAGLEIPTEWIQELNEFIKVKREIDETRTTN